MNVLVSLLALAGISLAQDVAPDEPSTVPVVEPSGSPTPNAERPLAVPARVAPVVTPARLQALRSYRSGRLELREETELRGGSAWMMGGGYGGFWGPAYGGWGWGWGGPVIVDPPTTLKTWGIYRGPERLDVPEFLTAVNAGERRRTLDTRIERLERRGRTWSVVAGVGGAGLLTGLVMASSATEMPQYRLGNNITLGGTLLMATGLVGASFPRGQAASLRRYPSSSLSGAEAQEMIDKHNEDLRKELGLSAADVWALEPR